MDVIFPTWKTVTLDKCPIGLFMCGSVLALMTEYQSDVRDVVTGEHIVKRDAYIVATGEYFSGDTTTVERGQLKVSPCTLQSAKVCAQLNQAITLVTRIPDEEMEEEEDTEFYSGAVFSSSKVTDF